MHSLHIQFSSIKISVAIIKKGEIVGFLALILCFDDLINRILIRVAHTMHCIYIALC